MDHTAPSKESMRAGVAVYRAPGPGGIDVEIFTDDVYMQNLCREYWGRTDDGTWTISVKALAAKYDIPPSRVSQTVGRLCVARSTDVRCHSCGTGVVVASRTELTDARTRVRGHVECDSCRRAAEEARAAAEAQLEIDRRRYLEDTYALADVAPIQLSDLTLKEAIVVLALLRSPEHFGAEGIVPLRHRDAPFAPTSDYGINAIRELFQAGRILIHPSSDLDAFVWQGEESHEFYLTAVRYVVPGTGAADVRSADLERRLLEAFRTGAWPDAWLNAVGDLWLEIAIEESIAHLQLSLSEHNLPFAAGPKTRTMYEDVLRSFSLGQVFNFNWRAAKDAAAYWVRAEITTHQAANSCVGAIQRSADNARASGWDVKHFSRSPRLPLSEISHVFFKVAMQLPDLMTARLG